MSSRRLMKRPTKDKTNKNFKKGGVETEKSDNGVYSRSRTGWVVVATLIKRLLGLMGRLSELLLPA